MSSVQEKGSCPDKKMTGMSIAYPDLSKFFMVMYMIQIHQTIQIIKILLYPLTYNEMIYV